MQGLPFAQLSQINSYIKPLLGGFERCSSGFCVLKNIQKAPVVGGSRNVFLHFDV